MQNFLNSRLYQWMDVAANFFFLNLLWLLACIPIVTIFPATAALFAVVRSWIRETDTGFLLPFLRYFRENFFQSLIVGTVWCLIGVILVVDYVFVQQMTSWVRGPLLALLALLAVVYGGTAVYLFPVMVQYQTGWVQIIKNSFLVAFSAPGSTLLCLLIFVLAGLASYVFPISVLVSMCLAAYLTYYLSHRLFQQIESTWEEKTPHNHR
jgi:uncharacterized membrane protein YesL